jgi:hypothetical protein
LALLLVFTSVAWAFELPPPPPPPEPAPGCFRIEGTSKWVKPWPPEPDVDGYAEFWAKAEGTVSGMHLFEGGRFTFMEVGGGNENTFMGWNEGILTVKPGPPGGKVVISFAGVSAFEMEGYPYVYVRGEWDTVRANGHYRDYHVDSGSFFGIADLCYPDYTEECAGFWVEFCE